MTIKNKAVNLFSPQNLSAEFLRSVRYASNHVKYRGAILKHGLINNALKAKRNIDFWRDIMFAPNPYDPVLQYANDALAASYNMWSYREGHWLDQVDITGFGEYGLDENMFSGIERSNWGIKLVIYDPDTQTFQMWAKKVIDPLDLQRGPDGQVHPTEHFIKTAYPLEAYHVPNVDPENPVLPHHIRMKFEKTWRETGDECTRRNQKHFTLHHAKLCDLPEEYAEHINIHTQTEILTNGRLFYIVDEEDNGTFKVEFYMPTVREDGGFMSSAIDDKGSLSHVSKVIGHFKTREEALQAVQEDWQGKTDKNGNIVKVGKSSKLWDGRKDLAEGFFFASQYYAYRAIHYPAEHKASIAAGSAAAILFATLGFKDINAAFLGSCIHLGLEHGVEWMEHAIRHFKARNYTVKEYGKKDCVDTIIEGDLNRPMPKADANKLSDPSRLQVLNLQQNNISEYANIVKSPKIFSVAPFIWLMEDLGLSSTAKFYHQDNIRLKVYSNGMVVLKIKNGDETEAYFARYREDACLNKKQALPDYLKDQMNGGIMHIVKPKEKMSSDPEVTINQDATIDDIKAYLQHFLDTHGQRLLPEDITDLMETVEGNFQPSGICEPGNVQYLSGQSKSAPNSKLVHLKNYDAANAQKAADNKELSARTACLDYMQEFDPANEDYIGKECQIRIKRAAGLTL